MGVSVGVAVVVGVDVCVGVGVSDAVAVLVGVAVGSGVGVLVGATVGGRGMLVAFGVGGFIDPHHFTALTSKLSLVFLGMLSCVFPRGVFFQEPFFCFVPAKVFLVTGSHRTQSPVLGVRGKYFETRRLSTSLCAATVEGATRVTPTSRADAPIQSIDVMAFDLISADSKRVGELRLMGSVVRSWRFLETYLSFFFTSSQKKAEIDVSACC